jgi:hypothetical protein
LLPYKQKKIIIIWKSWILKGRVCDTSRCFSKKIVLKFLYFVSIEQSKRNFKTEIDLIGLSYFLSDIGNFWQETWNIFINSNLWMQLECSLARKLIIIVTTKKTTSKRHSNQESNTENDGHLIKGLFDVYWLVYEKSCCTLSCGNDKQ